MNKVYFFFFRIGCFFYQLLKTFFFHHHLIIIPTRSKIAVKKLSTRGLLRAIEKTTEKTYNREEYFDSRWKKCTLF